MVSWRVATGVAGIAAGVVAASAGAVVAAEKIAVGRIRLHPDPAAAESLGALRGAPVTVLADDGVPLHAEVSGPDDAPVTVALCHGYTLSSGSWHYQRAARLRGARVVAFDHRGHGRSGRSDPAHMTISQLAADLDAVLAATVPAGQPVVLAGHSMGGMTVMALARLRPELFGSRVIGAALISTAAYGIDPSFLPAPLRPLLRVTGPPVLRGAARGRGAGLLEYSRRAGRDLAFLTTRRLSFGDPRVSPALVDFLERIIAATPVEVVAQLCLALLDHDERAALPVLGRVPVTVLTGDADRLIPPGRSGELAAAIPGAELVRVPGAGHVILLERPDIVNDVLDHLIDRALDAAGLPPAAAR